MNGVPMPQAVAGVLVFRLVSFWLPTPRRGGLVAHLPIEMPRRDTSVNILILALLPSSDDLPKITIEFRARRPSRADRMTSVSTQCASRRLGG
jgi:hypothetical protein